MDLNTNHLTHGVCPASPFPKAERHDRSKSFVYLATGQVLRNQAPSVRDRLVLLSPKLAQQWRRQ